jgi:hypothetical protein
VVIAVLLFVVGPAGRQNNKLAFGWWFIWIVRWCTDLQTLNFYIIIFTFHRRYTCTPWKSPVFIVLMKNLRVFTEIATFFVTQPYIGHMYFIFLMSNFPMSYINR